MYHLAASIAQAVARILMHFSSTRSDRFIQKFGTHRRERSRYEIIHDVL